MVIRFETTSVEKEKVKKRRIFRFIVSEIAEQKFRYRSSLSCRSIFSLTKRKFHGVSSSLAIPIDHLFSSTKQKCIHHRLSPVSSVFLSSPASIVYLFIDQKTKIPHRKTIPRIPNKISIHLFFLFFIIIINESIHRIPNGEYQSRVNYSCLRVVIETDRPISRELISVTCH